MSTGQDVPNAPAKASTSKMDSKKGAKSAHGPWDYVKSAEALASNPVAKSANAKNSKNSTIDDLKIHKFIIYVHSLFHNQSHIEKGKL